MTVGATQQEPPKPFLISIIEYVITAETNISQEELRDIVEKTFPDVGGLLVDNIAKKWSAQGHTVGLRQSLAKDREFILPLLRRYLATRFGLNLNHFDAAFETLALAAIIKLSELAFEVESLAAFETTLADLTAEINAFNNL